MPYAGAPCSRRPGGPNDDRGPTLETSRIQLEPLPPYSPNLNLIERFWKSFQEARALQPLLRAVYRISNSLQSVLCGARKGFAATTHTSD
ncbi:transposase [Thiorhodococcus minor]|uniref:transposase n=1 Tax=Thiorhodococcus minor TaxID=57489 RepID=UPI00315907D2